MNIFLSEGQIIILGDGGKHAFTTQDAVQEYMEDMMNVHFVGIAARAGVHACTYQLEHTFYTPGTDRNDLFLLHALCWRTVIWYVVSIPAHEKHLMDKIAASHALSLVSGAPFMFDIHGGHAFPVAVPAMYTMEGIARTDLRNADHYTIANVRHRDRNGNGHDDV
jgi:hypothetical protein